MPRRTIPEEIYLLAVGGRPRLRGRELAVVVRGALLADLSLRGCLIEENGQVRPSPTKRTGDPLLDEALHTMSEQRPRSWKGWVKREDRRTVQAVRTRLARTGGVREVPGRTLGVIPTTKVTVTDPAEVAALRSSLRDAVTGSRAVSTEDAVLVSLVVAGELRSVLRRREARDHRERIAEFTERAGEAVPALRDVVKQIKMTRVAVMTGGG